MNPLADPNYPAPPPLIAAQATEPLDSANGRRGANFPVSAAFAFALAMLAGLAWLSYRNTATLLNADQRQNQAHLVIHELDRLLSALAQAEMGERAFLVAGEDKYLPPYRHAVEQVGMQMSVLNELAQSNPRRQRCLRDIAVPLAEELTGLGQVITARREQGQEATRQLATASLETARLDAIRARVAEFQGEEQDVQRALTAAKNAQMRGAVQIDLLGVLFSSVLLVLVFFLLRKEITERLRAQREVFAQRDLLEASVKARTEALEAEVAVRLRTEERLRRNKANLAQAQAMANIGSWEWDLPTGEVRWSEQMFRLFGEPPNAFLPSFNGFMERVHPADRRRLDGVVSDALAQGAPYAVECRIITRQGTVRTVLFQAEVELAEDDQIARVFGIALDLTERRQAEETRAQLAAIVESSQDAIISKDLGGRVTSWNAGAEKLFGYTAGEMLGRPFSCMIPSALMDEEKAIMARVLRGEAVEHYETERLRKDGSIVPIAVTVSPLRDAAGNITGASKIARDISERKRAQQALQEADRRKDEFLAMLAHELRNPLTPIMVAAQLLQQRGADPALVSWAGDTIKHQGEHLVHLVNQLLDVSRVTQGKITLGKSPVDLREPLARAVEAARSFAYQHGHELVATLPQSPVPVEADRVRIEQVLGNLLNNAVKYTPDGGRIETSLTSEGEFAVIRVLDNGIGIAASMLPHVFELFTQSERGLDRAQGGLGIGLALVKNLVELHGGSVQAASAGAGRGSEFKVLLPLLARLPAAEAIPAHARASATRRVLVVDDNEDVRTSVAFLLESLGHQVRLAADGLEALAVVTEESFDAVLLDIGMPGLDGYGVARQLRQEPALARLVLVAMTGYGQDSDRQKAFEAGFDHHLVKPFDPKQLQEILAACMPG